MPISSTTFVPSNLLSHEAEPHVIRRSYPHSGTSAQRQPGYLVKLNATLDGVDPALAADDATLGGVILEIPDPADPSDTNVTVGLTGSYNKNAVKYADGTSPISAAGEQRLRDINIFLDPTVPAGAFAP